MNVEGRVPSGQLDQMQRVVDAQLAAAWARTDVFEGRATTVLGVIGVVLTVLFSVLSLVDLSVLTNWAKAAASAAIVMLLISGGYCLNVLRPRDVQVVSNDRLKDLWVKQAANPTHETVQIQAQVLQDIIMPGSGDSVLVSAFKEAQARGDSLLIGMWLFAAGVLMLACTVGLVLWVRI